MELLRKNGREFSVSFSAAPLGSSRGVIILRDISAELRRAEEGRVENERLSALAEASPLPHVLFCGRKLVHANAAFRKTFSWVDVSSGEATLREFLGKENASLARELSATEPADGELSGVVRDQITLTSPEGERHAYALSASRTPWNGKSSWYLTLSDVTARNAALESLRES
jgi:PAS domain-containing protein